MSDSRSSLESWGLRLRLAAFSVAGLSLITLLYAAQFALSSSEPELWFQNHCYMRSEESLAQAKRYIDSAAAAGYTGTVLWDVSIYQLDEKDAGADIADRFKELIKYARKRKLRVVVDGAPFGWSNDVLADYPNLAEGQRVIGTQFKVAADGASLELQNSFPGLVNGNFEGGRTGWFDTGDPNMTIGTPGHSSGSAATIIDPPGNARLRQTFKVHPWRQYYLSFFYKAKGDGLGSPIVQVLDASDTTKSRMVINLHAAAEWAEYHLLFNSGDSNELSLMMGVWGGAKGTVQFDDVKLEETGLVWLIHRDGAPFKLYDPEHPETVLAAGKDYDEPRDAVMYPHRPSFENIYHLPPKFTLPKGTSLKPGQIVAADYYAAQPLPHEHQVGMCLSEPAVYKWLERNAQLMKKFVQPETDILMNYDEVRHANSCALCRSKNVTAGELLAQSVGQTSQIYHQTLPNAGLWIWSDMFDPYHNARDHFYLVEGTLAGSWKGLPADVVILNWNLDQLKDSLTWFSGKNPEQPVAHSQIIAGFYDRADAAAEARREMRDAAGVPGLRGVMYTTWVDDFSKLKPFADAVRAAWPDYRASVAK